MIRFDDVVVRYPRANRDALAGVALEALRGRLTAVVGPNGSGKSTLVRALIGRVQVGAGRVLVNDSPIADRIGFARRVAVVTQREELAFPLSVEEYVALGRFPHLGGWRGAGSTDRAAVARAMERAGVDAFARDQRTLTELSGGEWQRVRLARALAQEGEALVLDEPTTFLDVAHEMAVFELLHQLAADGLAVLLVSHQLNLVARFADEIVLLAGGRVAAAGSPDDVMQAAVLERVYEWPLVVTRDPAVGAPALLPLRVRRRT
ncbi:MAG TPA: ABC transporter ATP-binding protein [Gemmatimonadaceae bacterium]|nr:ABC transporter ATP-binding protein [Gemmatimonadaceae bacterium]